MSIAVPELDTIDFAALLDEARGRIPRYAPEWTDHNLHDPGITLLELLAWVTDQQVYQVGLVGADYRRAFTRLLGIAPQPARPARGLLWPQAPVPLEVDLPLATRVSATEGVEAPYLVDLACRLSPAQPQGLVGAGSCGALSLLDTDRRRRASFPAHGGDDGAVSRLELRFDRPLLAAGGTVTLGIELENPQLQPEADLDGVPLWGPLRFEYRVGGGWRALRIVRDDTHALLRSGVLALEVPAVTVAGPSELRLRLERGFFPSAPRIARLELNALPVVQLELRPEALLAAGTGLPDQTRPLPLRGRTAPGALSPPLRIEVAGSDGWEVWEAADRLDDLGPDDRRVVLDAEREEVRFGNGINGAAPPPGAQIRHGAYALTLGAGGSVRAGLTWRVERLGAVLWHNPVAIGGGEDAWDTRRTELEAQRRARHPAVDVDDAAIREKLLELPGFAIARVEILPQHHPALPGERLPGHRTIVVVPALLRARDPRADEAGRYLGALRARLAESRPAGERLHVTLARCVPVTVRARLLIEPDARAEEVERAARAVLEAELAPLPPADQAARPGWPIGRAIAAGRLSGLLAQLPQVVAVTGLELAGADGAFAAAGIPLAATELPRGGQHVVTIERAGGGADAAG